MEFRILGPLEVHHGDRPVPLRGPRLRALLAALLIDANSVVAEDRLLEELWGDRLPASGTAALRVRVSQLRKALEGGRGAIVTRAPGYALEVADEDVDARCFEQLVGRGRAALSAGDPELAASTLREALGLWRGGALADFAYEAFAQAEIARLEELRLGALEARVDADLATGCHAELVGELEARVAEQPLRERTRAQLMLALYRAGRQAEALAAYRDARELAIDELGIEPGSELRQLERAMLRQDPSLAPAGARAGSPPQLPPERKLVTVLAARLECAGTLLDPLYEAAAEEIEAAGGRVESIVGDAIVASFGAPRSQEDHAERALSTALALRRRVDEAFGDAAALRLGVETGEAVVGEGRTLVGGPAADAARLAAGANRGVTLVGERAAANLRGVFELGRPSSLGPGLRGRPLLRALSVPRPRARTTAFVGRAAELETLRAAYARVVRDGRPHLVTVSGDAGVGKTRLVQELWEGLAGEQPEPVRRTGRCAAHGRGTSYRPLADVLREHAGLLETDPPELVRRRLGERAILGLTLGLDVAPELHPLVVRERLQAAWVELLGELAAAQPAVLLVEDLHWAHEPLLDLLERVLDDVRGPLLVLATARPELDGTRPSWGRRRDAATLWLERLSTAEARRMLDSAGRDELDAGARNLVLVRSEGNPFFLEELLANTLERGAAADEAAVPDSVHAVLAARIDLLPATEKAALQAASVIGRVFWRGPVRELLGGEAPDFGLLEARDFVRRSLGSSLVGEREFGFKHALTREVAYASVPRVRRAELHAGFAAWLERLGDGRDEHAALLAHHYYEAVRPDDTALAWAGRPARLEQLRERAVAWIQRAAALAIASYDLDDALVILERALELGPDEPTQLALWQAIGQAHALRHDGQPFLDAMTRAIELSADRETTAALYANLAFETALRAGMWRRRPGRELVDGWIDRALELSAPDSATRARALIARCVWAPAGTGDSAREASRIAELLDDPELRSYAWDARGITAWVSGEQDLGRAFEERRFELVHQVRDPDHVADIHYAPVTGCVWLGYFGEARRLAGRHDEITSSLTPHHRMHGLAVLVEVEELAGGWERIRDLEGRAGETILEHPETPCVRGPRSLLVCALAREHAGDGARARYLEERADEFEMEGYGHVLDTPRLRLALVRGDLATVERLIATPLPDRGWHRAWLLLSTQACRLDAYAALGDRKMLEEWPDARRGTYLEPFIQRARGLVNEDEALLASAAAGFDALGLHWHAERTRTHAL